MLTGAAAAAGGLIVRRSAFAAGTPAGGSSAAALIQAKAQAYLTATQTPGLAVAYHLAGEDGFLNLGVANVATRQPVTPDTVFEIGSITKVFTATLLASQLRDVDPQAAVPKQLGDPVTRYLPAAAAGSRLQQATLQELATHTSGLPREGGGQSSDNLFADKPPSAELLRFWTAWRPPADQPIGTRWLYSNVGFVTLGFAVAGQSVPPRSYAYDDLLAKTVAGPLGLAATSAIVPSNRPVAQGYDARRGQIIATKGQAADLKSTARDMLTWLKAQLGLLDQRIPGTLARALATTHTTYYDGSANTPPLPFDMGLAWQIHDKQPPLPPIFAKDGATSLGGFNCAVAFVPARQTALAVLTNLMGALAPAASEGGASQLARGAARRGAVAPRALSGRDGAAGTFSTGWNPTTATARSMGRETCSNPPSARCGLLGIGEISDSVRRPPTKVSL